jgi:hypothetical protein
MFMRVVTEALYNMFEDPTASPNNALLAFPQLHHIAAEDLPFAHYEQDRCTQGSYTAPSMLMTKTLIAMIPSVTTCRLARL